MINEETANRIHQLEKDAMTGNRHAVLELIGIRRKLHAALDDAWKRRYTDGTIDGAAASELFDSVAEVYAEPTDDE